jgi:2-polyprenyl-6-methoxyphenol hydroxylase-like FAD-dependent oxidoreductase
MTARKFSVIIAGAGPVGLSAALALRLANIDFLVLEKRQDVVIDVGASIAVGPASMRVMHQLGLLETLMEISHKSERRKALTVDGRLVKDTPFYHHLINKYGSIDNHTMNQHSNCLTFKHWLYVDSIQSR